MSASRNLPGDECLELCTQHPDGLHPLPAISDRADMERQERAQLACKTLPSARPHLLDLLWAVHPAGILIRLHSSFWKVVLFSLDNRDVKNTELNVFGVAHVCEMLGLLTLAGSPWKISTKLAAFVVLKGRQPRRQRQAEGGAACWYRAPSRRSCLWSCCAPQVWVQDAWWVVVKWGGGCVAQSFLHFTVPQLQLPSVGVYSTRHPTPKPAKRCRSSQVLTALVTSRELLRHTEDRPHTHHSHMPPPLSAPDTGCALTDFFISWMDRQLSTWPRRFLFFLTWPLYFSEKP